jgi:hypothetical protein
LPPEYLDWPTMLMVLAAIAHAVDHPCSIGFACYLIQYAARRTRLLQDVL